MKQKSVFVLEFYVAKTYQPIDQASGKHVHQSVPWGRVWYHLKAAAQYIIIIIMCDICTVDDFCV